MLVQKHQDFFRLITQHDHAKVSGKLAEQWPEELFKGKQWRNEVIYAVNEHDRGWVELDDHPMWNNEAGQPFSFMDYPIKPKIEQYTKGIEAVREKSLYAGLLCSEHYLSFVDEASDDPAVQAFITEQTSKNGLTKQRLGQDFDESAYQFHFQLLQFCDHLSLYFCLNEPGTKKEDETPMFKNGFKQKFKGIDTPIQAYWHEEYRIMLDPFPYKKSFQVTVPYYDVRMSDIEVKGLVEAFKNASEQELKTTIAPKN